MEKPQQNANDTSGESSSNENETTKNLFGGRVCGTLFPFDVTLKDIQHQRKLLELMEQAYELQQKGNICLTDTPYEIPKKYRESGCHKVEIAPGTGVYLPRITIERIETKAERVNGYSDWKILTRQTLLEVYGQNIKNFCARGTRMSRRPSISYSLFKALFDWASSKSEQKFLEAEYTAYVNSLCSSNRRYYSHSKITTNTGNNSKKRKKNYGTNVNNSSATFIPTKLASTSITTSTSSPYPSISAPQPSTSSYPPISIPHSSTSLYPPLTASHPSTSSSYLSMPTLYPSTLSPNLSVNDSTIRRSISYSCIPKEGAIYKSSYIEL